MPNARSLGVGFSASAARWNLYIPLQIHLENHFVSSLDARLKFRLKMRFFVSHPKVKQCFCVFFVCGVSTPLGAQVCAVN